MPLEDFIIAVFCCIESLLSEMQQTYPERQRGYAPRLADSEVLTMETVGEFLGIDAEKYMWQYIRRHWSPWFPTLGSRSRFVRQAANLLCIKQLLQEKLAISLGAYDAPIHIVDGFPLPVCHVARAKRCRTFREVAAKGSCAAKNEYDWGLHGSLAISTTGVITGKTATPAPLDERAALFDVLPGIQGLLIGDKGDMSQPLHQELFVYHHVDLGTPLRKNMLKTRSPGFVTSLVKMRRWVETVIGQLAEQFHMARVRTGDLWHLTSRINRKILAHTMGIYLNSPLGREPLQLDGLITD
jgi:hypothetical protein